MRKRTVVAMSGGVDSSVAAALLQKQGYEVIGITMCFNLSEDARRKPACCGLQGIEDARRVAQKLGIKHYVLNMQKDLENYVIKDFIQEYSSGRTPNPCVRCNQYLKFNFLLKKAILLGADFLATGHYARIEKSRKSKVTSQKFILKKARDENKDQSYFLYRLGQRQLRRVLFPLGDYTKEKVRQLARAWDLRVAKKPASQEICFLPDADYRQFLKKRKDNLSSPGLVVDSQGHILGRHQGIAFYTIGQRQGLGIAVGEPLYIIRIDPQQNCLTVGKKEEVYQRKFLVKEPHFVGQPPKKKIACLVRIRYNHKEAKAEIIPQQDRVKVCFQKPQFALTPGQSAVFYQGEIILGGGIIDQVF